jgi:hypothetical protein
MLALLASAFLFSAAAKMTEAESKVSSAVI